MFSPNGSEKKASCLPRVLLLQPGLDHPTKHRKQAVNVLRTSEAEQNMFVVLGKFCHVHVFMSVPSDYSISASLCEDIYFTAEGINHAKLSQKGKIHAGKMHEQAQNFTPPSVNSARTIKNNRKVLQLNVTGHKSASGSQTRKMEYMECQSEEGSVVNSHDFLDPLRPRSSACDVMTLCAEIRNWI